MPLSQFVPVPAIFVIQPYLFSRRISPCPVSAIYKFPKVSKSRPCGEDNLHAVPFISPELSVDEPPLTAVPAIWYIIPVLRTSFQTTLMPASAK